MNSIDSGWDSTKQRETSCFHCAHSSPNETSGKGKWLQKIGEKKRNGLVKI